MDRKSKNGFDFDPAAELIRMEAEGVARRHGLDLKRILSIYERCPDFGVIAPVLVPFETNLDRAIAIIGKEKALALFESEDLFKLAERVFLVDDINLSSDLPLYSLVELSSVTEDFIQYLLDNRRHLLNTGSPRAGFKQSPWLNYQLSNLYHFNFPKHIKLPPRRDRIRLKAARDILFDLKIKVLRKLLQSIISPKQSNPWDKCLPLLTESISAEESEFYLCMDRFYMGKNIRDEGGGLNRAGGLTALLEIIGHFDKEIAIGTFAHTRDALGILLKLDKTNRPRLFVTNYFEAVDHPLREDLDSALDLFSSLQTTDKEFWKNYRTRVIHALENDFRGEIVGEKVKRELLQLFKPQLRTFSRSVKSLRQAIGKLPQIPFSEVKESKTPEQFVFRKDKETDRWVIVYEGRPCGYVRNQAGLKYIHYLLRHAGKIVPAWQLYRMDAPPISASSPRHEKKDDKEPAEKRPSDSRKDHREKISDAKTIAECQSLREELQRRLNEAVRNNDRGEEEKLENQIQKVDEYLGSTLDVHGRLRIANNPLETARKLVSNSISRSKKEIYKLHNPLWRHLKAIHTGTSCWYKPKQSIPWSLD